MREVDRRRAVLAQALRSKVMEIDKHEINRTQNHCTEKSRSQECRMSSARKISANRANAQASTGPKSAQGKARAALNARRHGLSISVLVDETRAAEVESLAREIAGQGANPEIIEQARCIAEAQINLIRIREARQQLLRRLLRMPDYSTKRFLPKAIKVMNYLVKFIRVYGPEMPLPPAIDEMLMDKIKLPSGTKNS